LTVSESGSWPTEIQESDEAYESTYGNEASVHTTVWPAGIIHLATEEPEPPGGYG
jgi:hypothetical protein